MNLIMSPDRYTVDIRRYFDSRLAARKWLFVVMGVGKNALTQNRTIRPQHLPYIGKMIPTSIIVSYSDVKPESSTGFKAALDTLNIRRPGQRRNALTIQSCRENKG